jgi:hypothetical protein
MRIPIVSAIMLAAILSLQAASGPDSLHQKKLFENPPEDCRIMMRWWWFGPAVNKTELEREMKLMKEGGIGGFEVQPVYPLALEDNDAHVRNLPFLSNEFLDALRFTSGKARELGMRMDLTLGSGWPFGGPLVPVRDSAGKLRIERLRIPAHAQRLALPNMEAGEKFLAAFLCHIRDRAIVDPEVRQLTNIRNGAVIVPTGVSGDDEIIVFISSRTGMMVKRPAVGAEGFVLNHYDRSAIRNYLTNVGDRLLQALRPNIPDGGFMQPAYLARKIHGGSQCRM